MALNRLHIGGAHQQQHREDESVPVADDGVWDPVENANDSSHCMLSVERVIGLAVACMAHLMMLPTGDS